MYLYFGNTFVYTVLFATKNISLLPLIITTSTLVQMIYMYPYLHQRYCATIVIEPQKTYSEDPSLFIQTTSHIFYLHIEGIVVLKML